MGTSAGSLVVGVLSPVATALYAVVLSVSACGRVVPADMAGVTLAGTGPASRQE